MNKYRVTKKDIAKELLEEFDLIEFKTDDSYYWKNQKINRLVTRMFEIIKTELQDLGTVGIHHFGSFFMRQRKVGGTIYIKLVVAKAIKEFTAENIKKAQIDVKQAQKHIKYNILEIDEIVIDLIGFLYEDERVFKKSSHQHEKFLSEFVVEVFETIKKSVFEYKSVDIKHFGTFFLDYNELHHFHFKYKTDEYFSVKLNEKR